MYKALLHTCSDNVIKGINYLEAQIENDQQYFHSNFVTAFYVLNLVKSPLVEKFNEASQNESFWIDKHRNLSINIFEYPIEVWQFIKLGFGEEFITEIDEVKNQQTVQGEINISECSHTGPLRILALVEPNSDATKSAVKYFLKTWRDYDLKYSTYIEQLSVGMLALLELDYYEYKDELENMAMFLKGSQTEAGYFGLGEKEKQEYWISSCSLAINALIRVCGLEDYAVIKAIKWLESLQREDEAGLYHWGRFADTVLGLLALCSAGQGPKAPLDLIEWERELERQKTNRLKPCFIHTSPIYDDALHVKEIHDKIREMFMSAKTEIRIASLYIDTLYEDLINLAKHNQDLKLKIVARPPKDIEGLRERIAKNVLELLKIASKGNMRVNNLFHCRMIIVDDDQMIISSSDLTRDQLL